MTDSMIGTTETPAVEEETTTESEVTETETTTETQTDETVESESGKETSEGELIFGKYKDMDAAMDAFKTLESENGRLRREKQPEAPEEYSFDFKEDEDLKDIYGEHNFEEDPIMKDMLPVFKEANLTNEQAHKIVRGFGLHQKAGLIDFDSEVQKLEGGLETVSAVETYVQKNYTSEEQKVIANWLTDAESLSIFKKMTMDKPSNIPGAESASQVTDSSQDLMAKAMEIKSSNDLISNTAAREKYEALMNKAVEMQMKGL